ncbi:MAG: hypothetical protein J6Z00_02010 [Clostridia bacterium]|nr:hypothetical protein [Clostridia bacterium]
MRMKLYGNHIDPACVLCRESRRTKDPNTVLCNKKGAVPANSHCWSYEYDPLKRMPRTNPGANASEE